MYIYKTTNNINNKCYIGQSSFTVDETPYYLGSGKDFIKALKQYGKENFSKEILECDISNTAYLNEREIYWIKEYGTYLNNKDYNLNPGGEGCSGKRSIETKAKLSTARQKRLPDSDETKARKSKSAKNKPQVTNKTKAKLSALHKGIPKSEEHKVLLSSVNKGKKLSEETKRKIGDAQKGIKTGPLSKEHKAKVSATLKLYYTNKKLKLAEKEKIKKSGLQFNALFGLDEKESDEVTTDTNEQS